MMLDSRYTSLGPNRGVHVSAYAQRVSRVVVFVHPTHRVLTDPEYLNDSCAGLGETMRAAPEAMRLLGFNDGRINEVRSSSLKKSVPYPNHLSTLTYVQRSPAPYNTPTTVAFIPRIIKNGIIDPEHMVR